MFQIRDNKPKQLASHAVARAFMCARVLADATTIYVVCTVMAPRKEAAP